MGRLLLVGVAEDGFCTFANSLCHERTDVLAHLVRSRRNQLLRGAIHIAYNSKGEPLSRLTAFAAIRLLGHSVIVVCSRPRSSA